MIARFSALRSVFPFSQRPLAGPGRPRNRLTSITAVLFVCVAVLTAAPSALAASFSTVVIDPGHGGHDRGAHRGYYFEKHLALDVAFRLEKYLKKRGIRTVLTRRRDKFIPLDTRAAISNRTRGAIFVSIHFNAAPRNSGAAGIETFYYSSISKPLASAIQYSLIRHTRATNRGVKFARFRVIKNNRKPAALVECGFMTNSSERRRCLDPRYRQRLAESIGAGIIAYRRGR